MLEILKAVSMHESNIIIMDEPTSAITDKEVVILFDKIAQLKAKGAWIIYISHRLDELFQIADDIHDVVLLHCLAEFAIHGAPTHTVVILGNGRHCNDVHEAEPGLFVE